MLRRKQRRLLSSAEEPDPLSGLANMVDVMLVFACGLIVMLVLSWNLQNIFFARVTPQEKEKMLQAIQRVVDIEKGKELKELPNFSEGGGSGYQEMGTVYKDPKTGKLILIEN